MRKLWLAILPLVIVAIAAAIAAAMVNMRQAIHKETPARSLRTVETIRVTRHSRQFEVIAYGTVTPRTETELVAEVTGRIIEVSPTFVTGGFFDSGTILLRIDDATYQAEVARWKADLASAQAGLIRVRAEAVLALSEWQQFGDGEASDLVLRKPQLAEADARVMSAEAGLKRANIDLARTTIRAPYRGRIRLRLADEGQYLPAGTPIARVYATDVAEVRLPISPRDLGYLDLPLGRPLSADELGPAVELTAQVGAKTHRWQGRIVRTEGEVDARSRVIFAVAQVDDPYRTTSGPPLLAGTFVAARIQGHELENVAELPRRVLRGGSTVHVVDPDGSLRFRTVEILRRDRTRVIVGKGLESGEHVCLTDLDLAIDGMSVHIIERAKPAQTQPTQTQPVQTRPGAH